MATILTKKSDTSSSVPVAADLTNAAGGAELAVNTADKRLFAKNSGGTVVELGTSPSALTLPNGTANAVPYLNGSKVLTSGSALTFDGTNLGVGGAAVDSSTFGRAVDARGTTGAAYYAGTADNTTRALFGAYSGAGYLSTITNHPLVFSINSSEQMRLTSTGLGIGTSSPAFKADVINNTTYQLRVATTTGNYSDGGIFLGAYGTSDPNYWGAIQYAQSDQTTRIVNKSFSATGGIDFYVATTLTPARAMKLDSFGNLGLGVTPSAWGSGYKAVQLFSSVGGFIASGNYDVQIGQNCYQNTSGQWIYQGAAYKPSRYGQFDSIHSWHTAPSGTAGNAISFTQAMTLDASGNLLVGTTSGSARLNIAKASGDLIVVDTSGGGTGYVYLSGTTGGTAGYFQTSSGFAGQITVSGTSTTYATSSDYRLKNITGPITTSGAYIDSLNPVEGTWKADGSTFVGLIAHEVQEASRTQVATGVKDGEQMQGMDYSSAEIIANLIAELQSVRKRLAALEAA